VLLTELLKLVAKCELVYSQKRVFSRALAMVMGELFTFGRHTITQLLLSLGLVEEDWSAWYRLFSEGRFDAEKSSLVMLKEALEAVSETPAFVVGTDGFHVPRCSQTMPGTGWMRGLRTAKFKPGIERGQRFIEGAWLTPRVDGYRRAIPLRCLPAFTAKSITCEGREPCTEVDAGLTFLGWMRQQMDEAGRQEQQLLSLHDGT
jgi:hypothetical protein